MTKFPPESVFRIDREDAQRGDFIPREPLEDQGQDWWKRSWWQLTRELHEHDCGKRMYLPTPRECKGVERSEDHTGDMVVIIGCVILVIALAVIEVAKRMV